MNRQEGKESSGKGRESGGFDTLHLGVYGEWDPDAFGELTAEWDACKQAAEQEDREGAIWHSQAGHVWQVWGHGSKHGGGCRWVADWGGCTLFVANQAEAIDGRNNVFVQMHSLALMARGVDAVWDELRAMLAAIGFKTFGHKVSRIDVCVDLAGVQADEFYQLARAGHQICKAKAKPIVHHGSLFESPIECVTIGQRQRVLLRIYDKIRETRNDRAKRAILEEKRWGGQVEQATRVEFQVAREVLKDRWHIDTLDDLREKLPQLASWLTAEWYRLAECQVDRKNRNHERAKTCGLWQQVQEAFAAWIGANTIEAVQPRKVLKPKREQLLKQARGCLVTAFALGENLYGEAEDLAYSASEWILAEADRMFSALGVKRQELAVKLEPAIAGAGDVPF